MRIPLELFQKNGLKTERKKMKGGREERKRFIFKICKMQLVVLRNEKRQAEKRRKGFVGLYITENSYSREALRGWYVCEVVRSSHTYPLLSLSLSL